jgi:hypothetical protein
MSVVKSSNFQMHGLPATQGILLPVGLGPLWPCLIAGEILPIGLVLVMFEPVGFVMFLPVKVHLYYPGLMYRLTQLRAPRVVMTILIR